ncbi:hypothetical protein RRG08_062712 [Elysia crispata]|uniref:Uncharacterized protein n=1 Tax=Elysia crispata TaxID=231223 RepID=A0AAE1DW67_9GAST|nr:hypothetical protein RRG08_062712 [Elysia crispata]
MSVSVTGKNQITGFGNRDCHKQRFSCGFSLFSVRWISGNHLVGIRLFQFLVDKEETNTDSQLSNSNVYLSLEDLINICLQHQEDRALCLIILRQGNITSTVFPRQTDNI